MKNVRILLGAGDYHDLYPFVYTEGFKAMELGFDTYNKKYVGLLFSGETPTIEEINELLKSHEIEIDIVCESIGTFKEL